MTLCTKTLMDNPQSKVPRFLKLEECFFWVRKRAQMSNVEWRVSGRWFEQRYKYFDILFVSSTSM
jgi:hypothetical protein